MEIKSKAEYETLIIIIYRALKAKCLHNADTMVRGLITDIINSYEEQHGENEITQDIKAMLEKTEFQALD